MYRTMSSESARRATSNVRSVSADRALTWLGAGWHLLRATPGPSLFHGSLIVATGWLLLLVLGTHIAIVAALLSGFLLVGPVLAAAVYALSRSVEEGREGTVDASLREASARSRSLAGLGALLAVLTILWAFTSAELFRAAFGTALPGLGDDAWRSFMEWTYPGFFLTYVAVGAVLAAVTFILTSVAAPLLFDRDAGTPAAVRSSVRAVVQNPGAMMLWAACIATLGGVGLATGLLGFVIIFPWLGHTAWAAYRDLYIDSP